MNDADQLHFTVRRGLVDQGLRVVDIDRAVQQVPIDVVGAHGTVVRTADATEERFISVLDSIVDIEVLLRSLANHLNELTLISLLGWLHSLLSHTERGQALGTQSTARIIAKGKAPSFSCFDSPYVFGEENAKENVTLRRIFRLANPFLLGP